MLKTSQHNKYLGKIRDKRTYLNIVKITYTKPTSNIVNGYKQKASSLKSEHNKYTNCL